ERTRRLALGAAPSRPVLRASHPGSHEHLPPAARNILVQAVDVAAASASARTSRRFGRLVRELARSASRSGGDWSAAARALRRRVGATAQDMDAAAIALQALHAHPLWQRALASPNLRWDLPL